MSAHISFMGALTNDCWAYLVKRAPGSQEVPSHVSLAEEKILYELRSYDIGPERWDEYVDWATNIAFPVLFDQFGFRLVGFWEALPAGDLGGDDTASASSVHWILAWESEEERHARWAELRSSDAWKAAVALATDPATSERKYHRHRRVTLLRSWPISPLQ